MQWGGSGVVCYGHIFSVFCLFSSDFLCVLTHFLSAFLLAARLTVCNILIISRSWDRTYHASRSIFCLFFFNFLFVPCGGLSWLHVSFFYCTLNTHYRVVSYRAAAAT